MNSIGTLSSVVGIDDHVDLSGQVQALTGRPEILKRFTSAKDEIVAQLDVRGTASDGYDPVYRGKKHLNKLAFLLLRDEKSWDDLNAFHRTDESLYPCALLQRDRHLEIFGKSANYYGFDSIDTIRLIHDLAKSNKCEVTSEMGTAGRCLLNAGYISASGHYNTEDLASVQSRIGADFKKFIAGMAEYIKKNQEALQRHPFFADLGDLIDKIELLASVFDNAVFTYKADGKAILSIDPNDAMLSEIFRLAELDTSVVGERAYELIPTALHQWGFKETIEVMMMIYSYARYADEAEEERVSIEGIFPTMLEPDRDSGLQFEFADLYHPDAAGIIDPILESTSIQEQEASAIVESGIVEELIDADLLHCKDIYGYDTPEKRLERVVWKPKIERAAVERFLKPQSPQISTAFLDSFDETSYKPISISLSSTSNIRLVLGQSNNIGKSKLGVATMHALHGVASARAVRAKEAASSLPTGVVTNIGFDQALGSDGAHKQYLQLIHSLRTKPDKNAFLFLDEMEGTSRPHKQNTWFGVHVRKLSQLGWRAFVSSQNEDMAAFAHKDGIAALKLGKLQDLTGCGGDGFIPGLTVWTFDNQHQLQPGMLQMQGALRIAESIFGSDIAHEFEEVDQLLN